MRTFSWALMSALGLALCGLPLFHLLGYEAAAATGAAVGPLAALLSARAFAREPEAPDGPAQPGGPLRLFFGGLPARLALALPPAALLLGNMAFVRNCDPVLGLVFWGVIPLCAAALGHGVGLAAAALVPGRPRVAGALAVGVFVADGLRFAVRLALQPPIQGYGLGFGWFAGSLYDEALSMPASLLWYRLLCLLGLAAGLALLELRWRRRSARPTGFAALGLAGAALPGLLLVAEAPRLGLRVDRDVIAEVLGAELRTEHFIVHYDPAQINAAQRALLEEDLEFRYAELSRFFDEDPVAWKGRPIRVFLYPDARAQQRLFGSRGTFVARPWSHETHLRWEEPGDTALAHELAHLFTAPFGGGPLRLATWGGWLVHIGLVEGVALAADWPPRNLSPHETAAALRAIGKAPDVRSLFEPAGFWSQPGGKAYTLMGSFVRWLIDTRGLAPFKAVYAEGDWEGVYGADVDALVTEWEAFVDAIPVNPAQREEARFKHRAPSIFQKTCARTVAELQRQAGAAANQGDPVRALALKREVRRLKGNDGDEGLQIAELLVATGEVDEALELLNAMLEVPPGEEPQVAFAAQVRELRGDLLWKKGRAIEAAEDYARCIDDGGAQGAERRLAYKELGALHPDPAVGELLREYMVGDHTRPGQLWLALQWATRAPDDPLARYLVGLQLHHAKEYEAALTWLAGPPGTVRYAPIDGQRRALLGEAAFAAGQLDLAAEVFEGLREDGDGAMRMRAPEWLERIAFRRARAGANPE